MERKSQLLRKSGHPIWLLTGFWICVVIAIAAVLRRLVELVRPPQGRPPTMAEIDATFSAHAALTAAHIIPAALFVITAAAVLLRPSLSARLQGTFFSFGAITAVTAYLMSAYAVGGWIERSAVFVFNTYFLVSLARAYVFWRRGETALQRTWTTRAVGILLGIATTRPVMGLLFATSSYTHLGPREFFGIAFWAGFLTNALIIELWLHSKSRRSYLSAWNS